MRGDFWYKSETTYLKSGFHVLFYEWNKNIYFLCRKKRSELFIKIKNTTKLRVVIGDDIYFQGGRSLTRVDELRSGNVRR